MTMPIGGDEMLSSRSFSDEMLSSSAFSEKMLFSLPFKGGAEAGMVCGSRPRRKTIPTQTLPLKGRASEQGRACSIDGDGVLSSRWFSDEMLFSLPFKGRASERSTA